MHSKNEEFNNISEIEYEQNNNSQSENEQMKKANDNLDIKEEEDMQNEEDIKKVKKKIIKVKICEMKIIIN